MGFPWALVGGGYSTGALAQAMRGGEPKLFTNFSRNRPKMFQVETFWDDWV
jgi:hypothetical protein